MRIDWTDLRIFMHVCELGSMTAAAQRCHLTLAAVSARIRSMEEALGTALLHRGARGVAPTASGSVLASHAHVVATQLENLERDLHNAPRQGSRTALLLANSSALSRPLAQAVARAWDAASPLGLSVRESPSEATVHALRRGLADLGIVSDAVDTQGLVTRELGPDPLVLIAPGDHALASRAAAWLADALPHDWVAWGEHSALSSHLTMNALALGTRPRVRFSFPCAGSVVRMVSEGFGVSILPLAVVRHHLQQATPLAVVPLEDAWARRRLLACYRDAQASIGEALARQLVQCWPAA